MKTDGAAAHAEAIRLDIHELVGILNRSLGTTVVQAMTGTKDRSQPAKWASPGGPKPRMTTANQLRLGYRVWRLLAQEEGADVALSWLVGPNPRLKEATPVSVVRDLKSAEVVGAAMAFIDEPRMREREGAARAQARSE